MAGGILVAGLALITEVVLAAVQRVVTPGRSRTLRWAPGGPDASGLTAQSDGQSAEPGTGANGTMLSPFRDLAGLQLSHPRAEVKRHTRVS